MMWCERQEIPKLPGDLSRAPSFGTVDCFERDRAACLQAAMTIAAELEYLASKVPALAHSECSTRCRLDAKQAKIGQQWLRMSVQVVDRESLHRHGNVREQRNKC